MTEAPREIRGRWVSRPNGWNGLNFFSVSRFLRMHLNLNAVVYLRLVFPYRGKQSLVSRRFCLDPGPVRPTVNVDAISQPFRDQIALFLGKLRRVNVDGYDGFWGVDASAETFCLIYLKA